MELLFAVLGGLILGAVAHVVVPWRSTRGVLLGPVVGGVVAAVVWEALTWAGWRYDGTWIWVVALVGALLVAVVAEWVLGRRRSAADDTYFEHAKA
ncbi:hypothetical protein HUN58_07395 [Curtobacterium sp. Csp1]|uniref:GlsB/YeaQ/YmgE family stress response membrane protein n=1 Tax=Curtobacterium citreum TaxID=2036 RepID=A0ABT2HF09_9MICO|nr:MULTISPECIES: hypothetical protein [Curtobacterium]MCS6521852.1 hypothetical protein [Curtobacterium citreum]QKS12185.1 hypothetical protein HUN60_02800 [Curtobacterium sp. csp3]QKS19768.1 hypothetical protein HUN58_07395 [Curtobacterium sp. Csp1]RDI02318.1 hypothetical protein DEU32_101223 [Curtobacterium sp. AG1037]TQJ27243.1 hypothetical protein FB462_1091 [Curtobacterium citreum]